MDNQITTVFWILSLVIVLFIIILAYLIAIPSRPSDVLKKILNTLKLSKDIKQDNYPPYYWHKKSQFEKLPKSESDIIMLGDSITDEGEWTELLENFNVRNRGISGDTTERILYRLNTILELNPRQVFLMVGINDLINTRQSIAQVLEAYQKILSEFREKTPNTEIFIQSVLPVNNQVYQYWQDNNNVLKFNTGLRELAKQFNYQYIDLFYHLSDSQNQLDAQYTVDGLHLNGQAYLVWKSVIEKYITDIER
ncbi:GDSL-type esterase/lipase family protein [Fischerella sp. PCC 9605]|uniref:GDSL-type esterase/lipase family protein n=1 Tax=Fischerella sp. PCC 9605 TaxID=1173024 RepID=UPI000479872F|nr:GDSL-type esterase/lipase family protein [Fischerella sp. PCC 9605]